MNRLLLLLCLSIPMLSLSAQQIRGKVLLGLSETEGLSGVEVQARGFSTQTTDELGRFRFSLPGKQAGDLVSLEVEKEGFAVINRENLRPRISSSNRERIQLYLCPETQRAELALQYYRISVDRTIQLAFDKELQPLMDSAKTKEIAALYERKEAAERLTDSLAARLARFDPDNESLELAHSIQLYHDGKVEEAITILGPEKLMLQLEQVNQSIKYLKAGIESDIRSLVKAGDLALGILQIERAQQYYEAAVNADTNMYANLQILCVLLLNQYKSEPLISYAKMMVGAAQTQEERGLALNVLGQGLTMQNFQIEALNKHEEALRLFQNLARENPSRFNKDVARTYIGIGIAQIQLYQQAESLEAFEKASKMQRLLANRDSAKYLPDLARTLVTMGAAYQTFNKLKQAQKTLEEALEIYSKLVTERPDQFEPDLAVTLNNLGIVYMDLNQKMEALEVYTESLKLKKQLAEKNPERFRVDIGETYINLGIVHAHLNQYEKAQKANVQAAQLFRSLSKENPRQFEPYLAMVLHNTGVAHQNLNQYEESVEALGEAIRLSRKLAEKNPDRFEAQLASSLSNIANTYTSLNRLSESLAANQESLALLRKLAEQSPGIFTPFLAGALTSIGTTYFDLNRYPQSLEAFEESLKLFQMLSMENPERFEAEVANTMNNIGNVLRKMNRHEESLEELQKALEISRKLEQENPLLFQLDLARNLKNLGLVYANLNRYIESQQTLQESLDIFRALEMENSERFKPELAQALHFIGLTYKKMNQHVKAQDALEESTAMYLVLARKYPAIYLVDLADVNYAMASLFLDRFDLSKARHLFKSADSTYALTPENYQILEWQNSARKKLEILSAPDSLANAWAQRGLDYYLMKQVDSAKYYAAKAIQEYESISEDHQQYEDVQKRWAEFLSDMAREAMFVKQFIESEKAARRALQLHFESKDAISSLAPALLFSGKYKEAFRLYSDWKDKKWEGEKYGIFKEVFIADLDRFETMGVSHPDVKKIRKLLQE